MSNFNPDYTNPFHSSPVAEEMEKLMKDVISEHGKIKSDWIKEFLSKLMEKNNVVMTVSQDVPGGPWIDRIVVNGKIVSSFSSTNYDSVKTWRDPEFYKPNITSDSTAG